MGKYFLMGLRTRRHSEKQVRMPEETGIPRPGPIRRGEPSMVGWGVWGVNGMGDLQHEDRICSLARLRGSCNVAG